MSDSKQQAPKLNRIGDLVPAQSVGIPEYKADDLIGREVVIHKVTFLAGNFSEYAVIEFTDIRGQNPGVCKTGNKTIMAQLAPLTPQHYPVQAKFIKFGKYAALA